ncbi:MAG: 2-oxoglutarate dehydrogenase complex dihydrolipoyllysine-residue succinyltransferase [Deltaproteobacteria bacterium]|nr:2-oxoglutarate dehydrogenase complex dihydrolipoyllysine-residue succinyltransferase [Deltaproteobacteria bacterium]
MLVDVVVPGLGESVKAAIVAKWLKNPGDAVAVDEPLVSLDSDKATLDVPSPAAGRLAEVVARAGDELAIGALLARIEQGAVVASPAAAVAAPQAAAPVVSAAKFGPAVRAAMAESGVAQSDVSATGAGGRVTRGDVERAVSARVVPPPPVATVAASEGEEVVPMSNIRRRIAARLVEAQQTAAILTTFNEVDMSAIMAVRERYQERFQKKYGVKLGFMSFFVKAAIEALKAYPSANAEIRGTDIVYKKYYHVGVAVSGPRGLVVPVLRHADRLSFADTEKAIAAFGEKARNNAITVDDLSGGTFTLSNGGIFGSLMSTPILNPPQVAILGMHSIQKRPVVVDDQIVARPMMYLAVSYDHRLLDGREAVGLLVRIKECVEDPERVLLEV